MARARWGGRAGPARAAVRIRELTTAPRPTADECRPVEEASAAPARLCWPPAPADPPGPPRTPGSSASRRASVRRIGRPLHAAQPPLRPDGLAQRVHGLDQRLAHLTAQDP